MTGVVSWELLIFIVTAIVGTVIIAYTIWTTITGYIEKQLKPLREEQQTLFKRQSQIREEFTTERLANANRYVSHEHLRVTEDRMIKAIDGLVTEMAGVREMLHQAITAMAMLRVKSEEEKNNAK